MKKTRTLWQPWLLLIFFALMAACEEEDPQTDPPGLDTAVVISTTSWNADEAEAGNDALDTQNIQVSFTEGGRYTLIIPGLEGLGTTGSWELNSDQSVIILNDGSLEVIAEIVDISADRLVLEFDFENYKGSITTYRISLTG